MATTTRLATAAACVILLCATSATVDQQIRALTDKWEQAHARRDVEVLNELLDPGYVYTDATGVLQTRTEYITSVFKSPDISRISKFETSDVVVHVFGATAVVTGQSTWKGRPRGKGQFLTSSYRFTDVWVQRNGTWRAVATQGTYVAQKNQQ